MSTPNPNVRNAINAASVVQRVMHLWCCGYTVAMIQREVPEIERKRVPEILNVLADAAADIRRADD